VKTLVVTEYPSGKELDRVTLTDSGELEYATGTAVSLLDTLIEGQQMTPAQAFDARTDWSNGYVVAKLAPAAA